MSTDHLYGKRCTHHDHQQVVFRGLFERQPIEFEDHVGNVEALNEKQTNELRRSEVSEEHNVHRNVRIHRQEYLQLNFVPVPTENVYLR